MVLVTLVEVVIGLGAQLGGELLEYAFEDSIDGFLLGAVAVPDGDEVGIEANGQTNATNLVVCR